ncbi:MAG: phage late control D family protein [Lachnospiraceae bacterium]|nr:phage late control D family protein [Lachnospiraceae bacterium]
MANYDFSELEKQYESFDQPMAVIKVNDKEIGTKKRRFILSDVIVDLTSGYEASTAEFSIFDVYDMGQACFLFEDVKKFIFLGSKVDIYLGYSGSVTAVFTGVITGVNFLFEKEDIPCIRVTAMDVKGIMMSGSYSRQLMAQNYADAVTEILNKTAYEKLKGSEIIKSIQVDDTPDKQRNASAGGGAGGSGQEQVTDKSIEMVAESDYEFVVKVAKRNNFEFFTRCGNVYFRKAKSEDTVIMQIGPNTGMTYFDVSYDLTGLVEKIIVRGMDVAKAKVISSEKKFSNKISQGNKAKPLLSGSQKVYIDSTVSSKEEAEDRADSLMETMSYRYGKLACGMVGIPELQPGYFVELSGLGEGADNKFYINRVRHVLSREGTYETRLEGQAASAGERDEAGGMGGGFGL